MIKYCLPIIKKSKADVLKTIDENVNNYNFLEVWVDYIENIDEEFIKKISSLLQEKLIIVFRRQNLDSIKLDFKKIINFINIARDNGSFIDLDINTQEKELDYIKEAATSIKTIVSYHNYQITPTEKILDETIEKMKKYAPFLYKIATNCNNEEDAVRLLQLLIKLKKMKKKYIVLGMGEKGIITRIFGSIWGNEMTFSPLTKDEKSAPGQITKEQMENIFRIIQ